MAAPLAPFQPLLAAASGLDLSDPESARDELNRRFDPSGDDAATLRAALIDLLDDGAIAEKGDMPVKWGRVAKATGETRDFSIDVVLMNGAGPRHTHPSGEVNYCIAMEGEPTFEQQPAGWVVMPEGSTHVPEVENGTMLIVYLLPGGAVEFHKD
jgi:hypothetical protein